MRGNTGSLVKCVLEAARKAGAETEIFSLADLTVYPCKGCLEVCHVKGACQQRDDFEKIKNAMLKADGIIYASPNYNLNVSAQMEAFIDRCCLLSGITGMHIGRVENKKVNPINYHKNR